MAVVSREKISDVFYIFPPSCGPNGVDMERIRDEHIRSIVRLKKECKVVDRAASNFEAMDGRLIEAKKALNDAQIQGGMKRKYLV